MALRFQPYVSPETYLAYRDEAERRPDYLGGINQLAETIGGIGSDIQARRKQELMERYLAEERERKRRQDEFRFGAMGENVSIPYEEMTFPQRLRAYGTEGIGAYEKTREMSTPKPLMTPYQEAQLGIEREKLALMQKEKEGKVTEAEKQTSAKQRVSGNLQELSSLYKELGSKGGIVDVTKTTFENVPARLGSSGIGQMVGGALGTETQSIRNRINQLRPLLIQEIRQATQMGARGLDSEKELEFYLQAATDPKRDIQANLAAIDVLDKAYGLGLGINTNGMNQGIIEDGYRFKGGDPGDPNNWEKL